MKAPLSWLKEFVDIDISIAELAHLLTMAGMEVEELTIIGMAHACPWKRGRASHRIGMGP